MIWTGKCPPFHNSAISNKGFNGILPRCAQSCKVEQTLHHCWGANTACCNRSSEYDVNS